MVYHLDQVAYLFSIKRISSCVTSSFKQSHKACINILSQLFSGRVKFIKPDHSGVRHKVTDKCCGYLQDLKYRPLRDTGSLQPLCYSAANRTTHKALEHTLLIPENPWNWIQTAHVCCWTWRSGVSILASLSMDTPLGAETTILGPDAANCELRTAYTGNE